MILKIMRLMERGTIFCVGMMRTRKSRFLGLTVNFFEEFVSLTCRRQDCNRNLQISVTCKNLRGEAVGFYTTQFQMRTPKYRIEHK